MLVNGERLAVFVYAYQPVGGVVGKRFAIAGDDVAYGIVGHALADRPVHTQQAVAVGCVAVAVAVGYCVVGFAQAVAYRVVVVALVAINAGSGYQPVQLVVVKALAAAGVEQVVPLDNIARRVVGGAWC